MKALMDYAREDDDVYFCRLDRFGRSVIDVLNTVNDFTSRGVRLHSTMDNLDPTSVQGRMQLAIMATLAEYERELINERVRAGVISAQKRGSGSGRRRWRSRSPKTGSILHASSWPRARPPSMPPKRSAGPRPPSTAT